MKTLNRVCETIKTMNATKIVASSCDINSLPVNDQRVVTEIRKRIRDAESLLIIAMEGYKTAINDLADVTAQAVERTLGIELPTH